MACALRVASFAASAASLTLARLPRTRCVTVAARTWKGPHRGKITAAGRREDSASCAHYERRGRTAPSWVRSAHRIRVRLRTRWGASSANLVHERRSCSRGARADSNPLAVQPGMDATAKSGGPWFQPGRLDSGRWGKSDQEPDADSEDGDTESQQAGGIQRVVPFVEDRRNTLLIRFAGDVPATDW